jgi:peptide deformylase
MAELEILLDGHPVLRRKARAVRRFGPPLQQLVDDMFETLRAANGVGLAAPQVGVSERVVVIEIEPAPEDPDDTGTSVALINPEIVRSRGEEIGPEGCLSVPGFYGDVNRGAEVTVKALDLRGKEFRLKGQGLLARALQHEIDHLNGVLFVDLVEPGTMEFVGDQDVAAAVTEGDESGLPQ